MASQAASGGTPPEPGGRRRGGRGGTAGRAGRRPAGRGGVRRHRPGRRRGGPVPGRAAASTRSAAARSATVTWPRSTAPSLFGGGCVVVIRARAQRRQRRRRGADPAGGRAAARTCVLVVTHAGGAKGKALLASLAGNAGTRCSSAPRSPGSAERMDFVRGEFRAAGRTVDDGGRAGPDRRARARPAGARRRVRQLAADTTGVIGAARGGQVLPRAGPRRAGSPSPTGRSRGASPTRSSCSAGRSRSGWRRC